MRTCLTIALMTLLGLQGSLCRNVCAAPAAAGSEAHASAPDSGAGQGCHEPETPKPAGPSGPCAGCPSCEGDEAPLLAKAPDNAPPLAVVPAYHAWGSFRPLERPHDVRPVSTRAQPPPKNLLLLHSTLLI